MTTLTTNPTLGLYVAAAVAVVVVLGLFIYLWRIDRRVSELQRSLAQQPSVAQQSIEAIRPQRRVQQELIDGNDSRTTI